MSCFYIIKKILKSDISTKYSAYVLNYVNFLNFSINAIVLKTKLYY